ncbi:MAG: hypothetical protein CMB73_05525 [Euryarchaeota archaeon]|nr:hypothetical protein [Euryarchaeota archaeon]
MTGTIRNKPTIHNKPLRNCRVKGRRVRTRAASTRIRASNYSGAARKRREHRKDRRDTVDDQSDDRNLHIDHWDPEYQLIEMEEYWSRIEKMYGPIEEW